MLSSLREYLKSFLKKWLLVVTGGLGLLAYLSRFLGVTHTISLMAVIIVLFSTLLIVSFLIFHRVRTEREKLIKKEESYYYPSGQLENLANVLQGMRERSRKLAVDIAKDDIERDKLDRLAQFILRDKGLFQSDNKAESIKWIFELTDLMDGLEIGITSPKNNDQQWQLLLKNLDLSLANVQDEKLLELVRYYSLLLDGINSFVLGNLYLEKSGKLSDLESSIRVAGALKSSEMLLDDTLKSVLKRIVTLKKGR